MVEDNNDPADAPLTDKELIDKALHAANGDRFRLRFTSEYEESPLEDRYDTRRKAEVALLSNLAFWSQCNREQMWRVFQESSLYRPGLEEYPEYREDLLDQSTNLVDNWYSPNQGS